MQHARFVSPHRNYAHGVRPAKEAKMGPDGKIIPEQRELSVSFSPDLRTDEDVAFANSTFTFRGMPIFENGQPVKTTYRIAVFDTEVAMLQNGWTEAETKLVIATLRASSHIGSQFAELVPDPAPKPWNGYDEVDNVERIVDLAVAIDADLTKVIQYERENASRPEVIEALQAVLDAADEQIIVSA